MAAEQAAPERRPTPIQKSEKPPTANSRHGQGHKPAMPKTEISRPSHIAHKFAVDHESAALPIRRQSTPTDSPSTCASVRTAAAHRANSTPGSHPSKSHATPQNS